MSSYEMMKQDLPPGYVQPDGYQQQAAHAQYIQPVPLINDGQQAANEVQHHADLELPRSTQDRGFRRGYAGEDSDDEESDKDVLGPGELPDKALNVRN